MKNSKKEELSYMTKLSKADAGLLAINSSSKMYLFCRDTAAGIANFYREDYYPLSTTELKPFLKQITKEFKGIFKEKSSS